MRNSVPKLVNTIRPSLKDIAVWTGKSRALANVWRDGKFQPKDPDRAVLVKAVRVHAARLLVLADAVEREGYERAVEREGHERAERRREMTKGLPAKRSTSVTQ